MNFLSVQLTFRKIFVFVIDKSLSISGWGLVGMRVRGNMKKLDKKKKKRLRILTGTNTVPSNLGGG